MRLPPNREKFKGLTTSAFSAALGLNKHTTRAKLYRRFVDGEKFEGNVATEYGHEHEPYAVAWYEAEYGTILDYTGSDQQFMEKGPYGSTPDGLDPEFDGLVEFKCPYSQKIYAEDYWQPMYMPQLQGQMHICELPTESRFVVWTPDEQAVWRVLYSQDYVNWMLPELDEFMALVAAKTPPKIRRRPVPPKVEIERIL